MGWNLLLAGYAVTIRLASDIVMPPRIRATPNQERSVPLPHGVVVPLRAIEIDGVVVVPVVTLVTGVVIRLLVARYLALLGDFVDARAIAQFGVEFWICHARFLLKRLSCRGTGERQLSRSYYPTYVNRYSRIF